MSTRKPAAAVDPLFLDRWSTRAFDPTPLEPDTLAALLEAARWAPSCFNDQPWLFMVADTPEELDRFRPLLVEGNRRWASSAPVLVFVCARKAFRHNGKPNRWAEFDAGAAWMSLALQATLRGLYTHPMAGFHEERAHEVLGLPASEYRILAAVAIGNRGEVAALPEDIASREVPSGRVPPDQVVKRGPAPQA